MANQKNNSYVPKRYFNPNREYTRGKLSVSWLQQRNRKEKE